MWYTGTGEKAGSNHCNGHCKQENFVSTEALKGLLPHFSLYYALKRALPHHSFVFKTVLVLKI